MNNKCHFKIYIRDETDKFTIPLYKGGKVLVFENVGDANRYAQKEAQLKVDYKIK